MKQIDRFAQDAAILDAQTRGTLLRWYSELLNRNLPEEFNVNSLTQVSEDERRWFAIEWIEEHISERDRMKYWLMKPSNRMPGREWAAISEEHFDDYWMAVEEGNVNAKCRVAVHEKKRERRRIRSMHCGLTWFICFREWRSLVSNRASFFKDPHLYRILRSNFYQWLNGKTI